MNGVQSVNCGACGLLSYKSNSPSLQTCSSHSLRVLCIVHHITHHTSGMVHNIYTYDTVYVLSCVRCNYCGIYVYHGDVTYMAALCMGYMVYICCISTVQYMSRTSSSVRCHCLVTCARLLIFIYTLYFTMLVSDLCSF